MHPLAELIAGVLTRAVDDGALEYPVTAMITSANGGTMVVRFASEDAPSRTLLCDPPPPTPFELPIAACLMDGRGEAVTVAHDGGDVVPGPRADVAN